MKTDIQKKYFIGSTKPGSWSSVYTYKPHNPEFYKKRGEIFATISLKSPVTFNVATAGNLLLDHLHETYFENDTDSVIVALEKAVTSINKYLQKLLENDDAAATGIEIDLTVLVIFRNIVYLINMGEGHIHVFRDGNLIDISGVLRDPTGEGIIKIGSTLVKRADIFIISTPTVVEELTYDELIQLAVDFSEQPLKTRKYENESGVAVMLVGNQIDRTEAKAELQLKKQEGEVKVITQPDNEAVIEDSGVSDEELAKMEEEEVAELEEEIAEIEAAPKTPLKEKLKKQLTVLKKGLQARLDAFKKRRIKPSAVAASETTSKTTHISESKKQIDYNQPTYKVMLEKVKVKLVEFFKGVKTLVWDNLLGMGKNGIYLKGAGKGRNWRFIAVVVLIVAAVLYFSIKGVVENNQKRALEAESRQSIDAAITLIEEVDKVAGIVAKSTDNAERKTDMYDKLDEATGHLNDAKVTDVYNDEITSLESKIQELKDKLNLTIAETEPKLVIDLAGLFPGADASDIAISNNMILVSDRQYGKVYEFDYNGKNMKELASGLTSPRSIAVDENGDVVFLDEDAERRLGTIKRADGTMTRHAGTSEFRLGNVTQIDFANIFGGRVYGIDQNLKSVVALQRTDRGYGIPEKRFELSELASGKDIQIDNLKIYLLAPIKQGLYRSLNNKDDTPALSGLEQGENLFDATSLYINELYIFIADPVNKRVLVFDKLSNPIALKAQYVYRGDNSTIFANIKDLMVDNAQEKIFVLDGSAVYELDLKKIASL